MAKARALDKRRKSIRNIRKITRTMELISTARFKRAMDRALAAAAYTRRITALVGHLAHSGLEVTHPLLLPAARAAAGDPAGAYRPTAACAAATMRPSCGWPTPATASWPKTVPQTRLEVSGKRGISAFRFRKIQPDERLYPFRGQAELRRGRAAGQPLSGGFLAGQIDRLDVAYTKFESLSRQYATVETLLPLAGPGRARRRTTTSGHERQYEFLPSAASILDEVVPASFKVRLFKCFLDAA